MSKGKAKATEPKPPEEVRRLKFNGKAGYPFIVGIPARDLEHNELIELSLARGVTITAFVEMLCSNTPGRTTTAGKPLYSPNKPYVCPECNQEFDVWEKLHEHALTHIPVIDNEEEVS